MPHLRNVGRRHDGQGRFERGVGEIGQLRRDLRRRELAADVEQADAQHLLVAHAAQRVQARLFVVRSSGRAVLRARDELVDVVTRAHARRRRRREHLLDQLGMRDQGLAEELRAAEERDQQARQRAVLGAQPPDAGAGAAAADQIVQAPQRQIGIGRRRRLLEERARHRVARRRRKGRARLVAEELHLVRRRLGVAEAERRQRRDQRRARRRRIGERHQRRRRRRLGRAERGEDRGDLLPRLRQRAREGGAVGEAEPAAEERRAVGVGGQRVGLAPVGELEPMLDAAQEDVGVGEGAMLALGDDAGGAQAVERAEGAALAQPAVAPAVDELQRLREELDLADAAGAELDVAARSRRRARSARMRAIEPMHRLDGVGAATCAARRRARGARAPPRRARDRRRPGAP